VRRGGDCKNKYKKGKCASSLKIFSANCAGLKNGKQNSLNAELRSTNANIVMLQETHFTQKGKVKLDKNFVTFEAIRTKKGGGTALAIHEDLKPKLIQEYSDEFELLVVQIKTEDGPIRLITGYGPRKTGMKTSACLFSWP
jgi:exonuclease III